MLGISPGKWDDARTALAHISMPMRGRKPTTPPGKWPNRLAARRSAIPGMTQERLAEESGVSLKSIQAMERFKQRILPDAGTKLAAVLRCSYEDDLLPEKEPGALRRAEVPLGDEEALRKMVATFSRQLMQRWPSDVPFSDALFDEVSASAGALIDRAYKLGRKG